MSKGEDMELHISTVTVGDHKFADVRDFVPSTKSYGRGSVIPLGLASEVASALDAVVSDARQ